MLSFVEDPPDATNGFKPEYFSNLARLEEGNFWFRARNRLIQWALGNYFPHADSFFEIGCGMGSFSKVFVRLRQDCGWREVRFSEMV
jgi:hypothetical protein